MPSVQSTYSETMSPAVAGMIANQERKNSITRLVQDVAGIGFGKAVFRGTAANQATATPAAGRFLGISILDVTQDAGDLYAYRKNLAALEKGVIWVINGAATVAHGDQVYVTSAGAFTNVSTSNVILPGAFFDADAVATALVKVRLK